MTLLAGIVRTFKKENIGFKFALFGSSSTLDAPRLIGGAEYISIGSQVHIRGGASEWELLSSVGLGLPS
jgi:hypothetical protein